MKLAHFFLLEVVDIDGWRKEEWWPKQCFILAFCEIKHLFGRMFAGDCALSRHVEVREDESLLDYMRRFAWRAAVRF